MQVYFLTRFARTKPPVEDRQAIYIQNIYLDRHVFHVFQSQRYLVAERTESHQSIGHLGG